ncbi:MAG: 16S rRNA (cytosine(1402)-N(4))-methyltransferase RsmH [Saprospiraceae bacterium]
MSDYHIPVMLDESVGGLGIDSAKKQVFVDLTYGGGSHTKRILELVGTKSKVYSFDQDDDAFENELPDSRLELVCSNYRYFHKFLRVYGDDQVDGVLADLGVSSYQFDQEGRGFSYRSDQSLDMRMNQNQAFTAEDVLRSYDEGQLVQIFSSYGEIRNSKQLARQIIECRQKRSLRSSYDLMSCIDAVVLGNKMKYYAQVFQALRIEVNDEVESLKEMLDNVWGVLKVGGFLSVISYHSLEDRLVKNLMKTGNSNGEISRDVYGNFEKKFEEVVKGVILPGADEVRRNSRARSAKLRIARKI